MNTSKSIFLRNKNDLNCENIYFHFWKLIGDGHPIWKAELPCLFIVKEKNGSYRCNLLFKSKNQLQEHRIKSKHVMKQARKNDSSEKPVKQFRIEDVKADEDGVGGSIR